MLTLKNFIPAIFWFLFVLLLICLPGNEFPETPSWMTVMLFDKWVHLGLFAVLAYLFMRPVAISALSSAGKSTLLLKIAAALIIWGLTTEFIQDFFIPFRSFDWGDWVADIIGVLSAFLISRRMSKKVAI